MATVLGSPEVVLTGILDKLRELGVDVSAYEADHICFRCASVEEYRVSSITNPSKSALPPCSFGACLQRLYGVFPAHSLTATRNEPP